MRILGRRNKDVPWFYPNGTKKQTSLASSKIHHVAVLQHGDRTGTAATFELERNKNMWTWTILDVPWRIKILFELTVHPNCADWIEHVVGLGITCTCQPTLQRKGSIRIQKHFQMSHQICYNLFGHQTNSKSNPPIIELPPGSLQPTKPIAFLDAGNLRISIATSTAAFVR